MKKLVITACVLLGLVLNAHAQYDPEAKTILDNMSARYKQLESFQATVTYSISNDIENLNEFYEGEVAVSGDKYRLNMGGQEVINDGTTLWTYLEEVNEVNITDYDPDGEEITPSQIYSLYQDGYNYAYISDREVEGSVYQIVELVPEDKESQFFKIRLEIGKEDATLRSWQMFDQNGNVYEYLITDFEQNPELAANYFTFVEADYDGVDVVDFR